MLRRLFAAAAAVSLLAACQPGDPGAAARSAPPARPGPAARWVPAPGITWQWQLSGPVDPTVAAEVFDIDGFLNGADVVADLHRRGRRVVCYVEVGAAEDFRPDHAAWPPELLGRSNGWPGERWLDVRNPARLEPVLAERFDMCAAKGFDAIEPDLMDGYANDTGFAITAADQLRFNRFVARLAHDRGLSVALKNDVEQTAELVGDFDFAVNEECAAFAECAGLTPFIEAGKAVLHAEYDLPPAAYCAESRRLNLSSLHKNRELDVAATPCPAG